MHRPAPVLTQLLLEGSTGVSTHRDDCLQAEVPAKLYGIVRL